MSQQTSNHSFDELTRGLASGSITRSKALRLMGAALVGARWHRSASAGWPLPTTSVSGPGRSARRTSSAVAATAPAARAPLVRPGRWSVTGAVSLPAAHKDRSSTPLSAPASLSACLTSGSAPPTPRAAAEISVPTAGVAPSWAAPAPSALSAAATCRALRQTEPVAVWRNAPPTVTAVAVSFCIDVGAPLGRRCLPL